jgi:hypothetical protein
MEELNNDVKERCNCFGGNLVITFYDTLLWFWFIFVWAGFFSQAYVS